MVKGFPESTRLLRCAPDINVIAGTDSSIDRVVSNERPLLSVALDERRKFFGRAQHAGEHEREPKLCREINRTAAVRIRHDAGDPLRQQRLQVAQKLTSSGLFPPQGVNVVRWDGTPDGWGVLILEAERAEDVVRAIDLWRASGAGFFKSTRTAPAIPIQDPIPVAADIVIGADGRPRNRTGRRGEEFQAAEQEVAADLALHHVPRRLVGRVVAADLREMPEGEVVVLRGMRTPPGFQEADEVGARFIGI